MIPLAKIKVIPTKLILLIPNLKNIDLQLLILPMMITATSKSITEYTMNKSTMP